MIKYSDWKTFAGKHNHVLDISSNLGGGSIWLEYEEKSRLQYYIDKVFRKIIYKIYFQYDHFTVNGNSYRDFNIYQNQTIIDFDKFYTKNYPMTFNDLQCGKLTIQNAINRFNKLQIFK